MYDQRFVDRMWHDYPEWYDVTEPRVANIAEDLAFGFCSRASYVPSEAYEYSDGGGGD